MRHLPADLWFVARQLTRRPLFLAVAVLTLGLGTGAATAILTVVDRVLLRPLPYPEAGRLVALCERHPSVAAFCVVSPPNAEDWRRESRTLADVGQARSWSYVLRAGTEPGTGVSGGVATPGMFRVLGLRAARGRLLTDEDMAVGRQVVVLTDELWRTRFGANPAVVGATVTLDREPYEVVGVLEPALVPHLDYVKLWAPLPAAARAEDARRWRGFVTLARLAPGVTIEAAQQELAGIHRELARRHPETVAGWDVGVRSLLDDVVGPVRPTLLAFLGAVALLLLVACANVTHLMLARGAARAREFAVRSALGARPGRLFRLVVVESALLALAGGALGLLLAAWGTDAFLALMPRGLPRAEEIGMDARVFAVALAVTMSAGLAAGLVPAWRASRFDVADVIRQGNPLSGSAGRLRAGLVVAEIALACMLATGAGLLARTFAATQRWEPGFDRTGLVTFWTYASSGTYRDRAHVVALWDRLSAELRTLPGVSSVGLVSNGPLFGGMETDDFTAEGSGAVPVSARWYDMSPGYFATLGLPLVSGRAFAESDGTGAPRVAIVNQAMARRLAPGGDALGRVVKDKAGEAMQIVGIVPDVPPFVPGTPAEPEIYWPIAQGPRWASFVVIRTAVDPGALERVVAQRLREIDADMEVSSWRTMDELVAAQLTRPRFNMLLIGAFAAVALLLTAVGVYGVLATTVAGRTRELGVRFALGATRSGVTRMVLRDGLVLIAAGLVLGTAGSLAASRLARTLVHGVPLADPVTYLGVVVLLVVLGGLACAIPARRASRVDPMVALRSD